MRKLPVYVTGVALALIGLASPVLAKDISVQMKTQGTGGMYVFNPMFVKAAVGDKVHFLPTDPSHNAELIPGMLPAGVAPSKGQIGKEFVVTVSKPGVYGISCLPHQSMGMVGLVQAGPGPSPNLAAAKAVKLPPLAAKRMTPLLAQAK